MGVQDDLNKFYDIHNLVTVKIDLPDFEKLRNEQPAGGNGFLGPRYTYFPATSVTISGSKFPKEPATFQNVGAVKKSYFGSKDEIKPSIKLNFKKYDKSVAKACEKLIGTARITMNNCKQDPGYFRQPLVNELWRQAGVPYFRCNFVHVYINNEDIGLYVNIEPFEEPYLKNNLDTYKGNAYELDYEQDFNDVTLNRQMPSFEGFSDYEDKKDFILAKELMQKEGVAGVKKVIDMKAFMKFWAMEILVKHRDGYAGHQNNTFAYNDVKAIENPTDKDINFKFCPSGTDMTLSAHDTFYLFNRAVITQLLCKDEEAMNQLKAQIKEFKETIFSPANYKKTIEPYLNVLLDQMKAAGVKFDDNMDKEVETAKASLNMAGTDKTLSLAAKA